MGLVAFQRKVLVAKSKQVLDLWVQAQPREGIRRAPLSLRTREIVSQLGLTLLLLLMGFAIWNDLSRQWTRLLDWLSGA